MSGQWELEPDLDELHQAHALLSSDPSTALQKLRALADRGSTMSMIYIADAQRSGTGTAVDLREAEHWYKRAAERGSLLAEYELGRTLLRTKAYAEAVEAFRNGASKNYPPSIHMLGLMFLRGNGVPKDLIKARDLFEKAAAVGNVFAKRNLGVLLMRGGFGPLQIARGALLFVSSVKDALVIVPTDPESDRLR